MFSKVSYIANIALPIMSLEITFQSWRTGYGQSSIIIYRERNTAISVIMHIAAVSDISPNHNEKYVVFVSDFCENFEPSWRSQCYEPPTRRRKLCLFNKCVCT